MNTYKLRNKIVRIKSKPIPSYILITRNELSKDVIEEIKMKWYNSYRMKPYLLEKKIFCNRI